MSTRTPEHTGQAHPGRDRLGGPGVRPWQFAVAVVVALVVLILAMFYSAPGSAARRAAPEPL